MNIKIIKAAIGVSLIAAFVFYQGHFSRSKNWNGSFVSTSQGTFAFGGNGQDPLKTSSNYSGELMVEYQEKVISFLWLHPVYHLTLGITESIQSEPKTRLHIFLSQPWMVNDSTLKVSSLVNSLSLDEKLLALNLLRKISDPFLRIISDSASDSNIVMADYHSNGIHLYEQAGGTYQVPWSVSETTFTKNGNKVEIAAELKDSVSYPLELDQGKESDLVTLKSMSKNEISLTLKDFNKNSALIKRLLKSRLLSYQDFLNEFRKYKPGHTNYQAALVALIEVDSDESIEIISEELMRNSGNQKFRESILYTSLSMKRISPKFFTAVLSLANADQKNENIKLIACHFTGLYANQYPSDPKRFSFIQPYLEGYPRVLPCLGNAGLQEAEKLIISFMNHQDQQVQGQAVYSLRFIKTNTALLEILRGYAQKTIKDRARDAIQARIERGIFEKDLWNFIKKEIPVNSEDREFLIKAGKSFIMNFAGAFRESKQADLAQFFWK